MLTMKITPALTLLKRTTLIALVSLPLTAFAVDNSSTASRPDDKDHAHHHDMKMTGNADYDFAMMMKKHHEKGLKMAQDELDKGKDPDMRAAATKIIETQKKEIEEFEKWMAAHPQK